MKSDWKKILCTLATSTYAKRVGSEHVLTEYLNARSQKEVQEAFLEVVPRTPLRFLLYRTKAQKIRGIIKSLSACPRYKLIKM